MTSILEGQPHQNKAFSNQNKGHYLDSRKMIWGCKEFAQLALTFR